MNEKRDEAILAVRTLLEYLEGGEAGREGLLETPERVVSSWEQIFQGY